MEIDNYTHARILVPAHAEQNLICEGKTLTSFTPGKSSAFTDEARRANQTKVEQDLARLAAMGPKAIEQVLANAKQFSEALNVLGVGRKTFGYWLEKNPDCEAWMGRTRAVPIWRQ